MYDLRELREDPPRLDMPPGQQHQGRQVVRQVRGMGKERAETKREINMAIQVSIIIEDGVADFTRAMLRVAQCVTKETLRTEGEGKTKKNFEHYCFANEDGTKTYVKNFYRKDRKGDDIYFCEVCNPQKSQEMMDLKAKVDAIMKEHNISQEGEGK